MEQRSLKRGSYKFEQDARKRFLQTYEQTGLMYKSARAAGVSEETVRLYIRDNIEGFREEFEEARGQYRDSLEMEIHRRSVDGWDEPVIGGKDRDIVVTHVRKYSDRLLELHAKRHIPDYRDKQQVDLTVKGGVIAIPAAAANADAWEAASRDLAAPAEVIQHQKEVADEAEDQG